MEAAARELREETGLEASLEVMGMKHKMDYSKTNLESQELLEDKFFFIIRGRDVGGNFQEKFEAGKNLWKTHEEIKKMSKVFEGMDEVIEIINQNSLQILEKNISSKTTKTELHTHIQ